MRARNTAIGSDGRAAKMRVTFVSSGLNTGGAESALLRLLPALRAFGIEPSVVSLRCAGTVGAQLESLSIPTFYLGLPRPAAFLAAPAEMIRRIRRWRSDVVHGWMYHGNLAASMSAARLGLPVLWGIRQSLGLGTRDKWLTRRVIATGAVLSAYADAIVYNSAAARQQHERRGYCDRHATVLPNGFDTERLRPDVDAREAIRAELALDQAATVIGHVARFHPAKDHRGFLIAAARLRQQHPAAAFVLAGEGVDASNRELAAAIDSLGLAGSVRLLGRRADIPRLMNAFDVLCLTSSGMEGFPNVIGEAMSCQVPCVGTAVGDVADLIGDTGEVVAPGDPQAVAAALARLLALEPAARAALGAKARQRIIDRYSIGDVARRYADLLHAIAKRRH
jgi:glycosyltransferase involved in cell wall biosynthesis